MSLTKLLMAPLKMFKKDVITFLKIRRHDLGRLDDKLRYIAVKPTASIFVLRRKVWLLLDLPDYCEEVIVLKSKEDTEIPLTELRKGNDPQHPFILEVWLPSSKIQASTAVRNMLTLGNGESYVDSNVESEIADKEAEVNHAVNLNATTTVRSNETMALNGFSLTDENKYTHLLHSDYKKSEMSCRLSCTSFFKIPGSRKNRDSFTNMLLKIQSDLCTLSNKLSNLENRIPV